MIAAATEELGQSFPFMFAYQQKNLTGDFLLGLHCRPLQVMERTSRTLLYSFIGPQPPFFHLRFDPPPGDFFWHRQESLLLPSRAFFLLLTRF